jgi:hypothetical protein
MKYTVEIKNNGQTVADYENLPQKEAERVAKIEAGKPENKNNQVFVTFFRSSDGQHGYLNSDGNHDIGGQAW